MSKLTFFTPTTLDEAFIFTMGASVKKTNNPIGFFGTGLKYAIAVTLRRGGKITIETQDTKYNFFVKDEKLRGEDIKMIYCSKNGNGGIAADTRCPMTVDYGKTWEPWMALRELYTNTLDENGEVVQGDYLLRKPTLVDGQLQYSKAPTEYTLITIEEPQIYDAWLNRAQYFLNQERTPIWKYTGRHYEFDLYSGHASAIFYRGIAITKNIKPTGLTYNVLAAQSLTEDRTVDTYSLGRRIIYTMTKCNDVGVLSTYFAACCRNDTFEHDMNFVEDDVGTENYMQELHNAYRRWPDSMPDGLARALFKHLQDTSPLTVYRPRTINEEEQRRFDHCIAILERADMKFKRYEFNFSEDLGSGYALVNFRHRTIILNPKKTLNADHWEKQTVMTLIEEYVHTMNESADRTRELQDDYNKLIYELITGE